MNEGRHREFIIGLVALIALAALIFLTLQIRGMPLLEGSYDIHVRFKDVAGTLTKGAPISVYGVRVGEVTDIAIEPNPVLYPDHPVRLTLRIRNSMTLYESTVVEVVESTIIGETTVAVTPGSTSMTELVDGMIILGKEKTNILDDFQKIAPEILFQIAESVTIVNSMLKDINDEGMVTEAVEDFSSILSHVEEAISGSDGGIQGTLSDLRDFSAHLNASLDLFDETLIGIRAELATMRTDLGEAVTGIDTRSERTLANANDLIEKLDSSALILENTLAENAERWTAITARADTITGQIESIMQNVESGEGSLGKLLTDDTFHREMTDFFANLNTWLLQVDAIVSGVDTPPEQRSIPHISPAEAVTP